MYIQMEFCDNQTLRSAIDKDLYKDTKRLWKMFREIIEGLLHIHSQGMIHRDLKPVNIFLDSSDQGVVHQILSPISNSEYTKCFNQYLL